MCADSNSPLTALSQSRINLAIRMAVAAGAYAAVAGVITILGWAIGSPRLTDWIGSGIAMFPNTAVCAMFSGAGLILLARSHGKGIRLGAICILAITVALIGGLTFFEHVSGINLGIDTILSNQSWGQRAAASPMRMGPPAATSFLILGTALFLATAGQRARRLASTLATLPIGIASLSLIGYWFGSDRLFTVVHLTGIAFQTSTIIAALGVGLMACLPERGLVALLCRDDAGGMLVRRLLLPITVIPVLIGWLVLLGRQAEYYDAAFGISIMLLSMVTLLLGLLCWTAFGISRAAQAASRTQRELEAALKRDIANRMQAEIALLEREQRYELVLQGAEAAIWDWNVVDGQVLYSPRWKQLRGLSDADVSDSADEWSAGIHPEDRERVMAAVRAHFAGRTPTFMEEYRVRHKAGHWLWVLNRGIARYDDSGRAVRMAGSETDITERKQLEEELRVRIEELAVRDQRKTEFLATLAHELRNPLAPICSSLQILRIEMPADSEFRRSLEIMERQVNHMVQLVDDLLEVSRITSGKIDLRCEPIDLAAVIESAIETSKPLIEASRHRFTLAMPAEPLTVMADALRLSQVVANLLNNAAKYTEAGGTISLSVSRIDGNAEISVKDTGVGISPDMLHDVFRMFSQAGRDHKRAQGGLGIGLALAKNLAEKQGGRIEARSEGEGRGSEFIVRLPLAAPRTLPSAKEPMPALPPAGVSAGRRVLVVDDNCDAASSLAALLRVMGSEVRTANDGLTAIEAVESFRPSLVLLDLGMPDMTGYEVAEHIQNTSAGKECILVALTGWGQAEDRQRTKEAGFKRHLVKPIEFATLKTLVAEFQAEVSRDAESCANIALP